MSFMDATSLGLQTIAGWNAQQNATFDANMAAAQANSNAMIGAGYWNPATSPNTNPATGMTYPGAGMVQSYPSFGEASYVYPGYGPRPGVPTQQPDYSSYVPEQAFSPSGGSGGYTPASTATPYDGYDSLWDQQTAASYNPFTQYGNGGYDPFSQQTYQPAAQPNVGDWGSRFASVQPQEPAYQPYTNPYTGYPFNEAYPPGNQFAPQGSPSYQWPPGGGSYGGYESLWEQQNAQGGGGGGSYSYDINGSPSWVPNGGYASAAASGQGDVWGGGAASAAAAYNPFSQYANGGYDPFSQQTYQPAAQQNVGGARGGAYGGYESLWEQQTAAQGGGGHYETSYGYDGSPSTQWVPDGGGGSFADRFGGAEQPQLPGAITEGGYPRWDQRWDQIGDPYTNVPLNNALWQRGMDAGPQQPGGGAYGGYESLWEQQTAAQGGGGGHYETSYGYDGSPSTQWVPDGGGAQGGGSGYNPFQQYQSGGYNPFASSYENDLSQLLQGIDQGRGGGQQNYPSWQSPSDTLTPDDRGGTYVPLSYNYDGSPSGGYWTGGGGSGPYGGYESLWEQQTANDARSAAAAAIMAQGGDGMADFQSPANNYNTFQQPSSTPAWQRAIPPERSSPELVSAINSLSQQYGFSPEAMAAVINMESVFNPLQATGSYRGLTQMGPKTFAEAGGTLNGLTWEDYQKASPAQQAATYGAWIDHYAKTSPDNAASLVKGGIGSLPPEMQAAIMQATQFGPNATGWVKALREGNMSVPTSTDQAEALRPWTIEAMRNEFERRMQGWGP